MNALNSDQLSMYKNRRANLQEKIQSGIIVFLGAPSYKRNHDTGFSYRQNSNFYYYTGLLEENSAAILIPNQGNKFVLFVQPRDLLMEQWNGKRVGVDAAPQAFGADEAYDIAKFSEKLQELLRQEGSVAFVFGDMKEQDEAIFSAVSKFTMNIRKGDKPLFGVRNCLREVYGQRMIKAPEEIELMRTNAKNSALAHIEAMQATTPGKNEADIKAVIEYGFAKRGAQALAYSSIVAGGMNATILHYIENNQPLRDGDLLLIDAGGERDLYASDITRTFPVNGKFSAEQKDIYEVVLRAQKEAVGLVKPGIKYTAIHEKACEVLTQGLIDLGVLSGSVEENLANKKYADYYPHGTGHWIGLDVHDVGLYVDDRAEPTILQPGMVFTVEPGLYFPEHLSAASDKFRGIGVRIEDDILVTDSGFENLTEACPKEISEIEKLVGQSK